MTSLAVPLTTANTTSASSQSNTTPSLWLQIVCAAASGAMIGLPFIFPELFIITWIAWVPLLCACHQSSAKRCYFLGLICGLVCYTISLYWITDFVFLFKGYSPLTCLIFSLVFWLYSAQLQALMLLTFAIIKKYSKLHPVVFFPPLVVVFHAGFPALFSVQLGESQSQFVLALQSIELTGVYGLDWVIAISSVAVYSVITRNKRRVVLGSSIAILFVWFATGAFLQVHWSHSQSQWPQKTIGIVQSNEPPILGKNKPYPGFSLAYPPEMAMTEQLANSGAELVLWPEGKTKSFFTEPHVAKAYQNTIDTLGVPLVFQDMDPIFADNGSERLGSYNTAVLLSPNNKAFQSYQKMKRIAVGESLPVVSNLPFLHNFLRSYLGDFFKEIYAGKQQKVFTNTLFSIVPLVCYEVIFPDFSANAAALTEEGSPNPLMVTLSSDAWFGDSHQPRQHVNTSILRTVENRMPLVHVVNNGPSIAVNALGEVIFETPHHQAGGYLVNVPIAPEYSTTFFNQHPKLVLVIAWMVLATLLLWHVVLQRWKTRY